uniref:VM domain-containing protein n=1 Tax=Megaselia scalaris TaxID=36166 RepID=T1H1S5_MEGSC
MKFTVVAVFTVLAVAQTFATVPVVPVVTPIDTNVPIVEHLRAKKAAYGGSSYSAPPCPTNYLFSCGPQLQPVGCSQASYGSAGAYSINRPQYVIPQNFNKN